MSDSENFLCFSSATAQRCGTGTAEARAAPSQRKNKESFQNRSYHMAIDERTAAPSQRKNKESFQNRSYHLAIDERNEKRI